MKVCAGLPGWAHWAEGDGAPADGALTLDAFAEASLGAYLATRDFTALHLVTATQAWRSLSEATALADDRLLRRRLWRAWFTTWLTIGRPEPDWDAVHRGPAGEAAWATQAEALFASRDEHRIKLAWSALIEWRHRGWPGYARVLEATE
jgi:Questin oxidase-like